MQVLRYGFLQSYTSFLDAPVPTSYGTGHFTVPWGKCNGTNCSFDR